MYQPKIYPANYKKTELTSRGRFLLTVTRGKLCKLPNDFGTGTQNTLSSCDVWSLLFESTILHPQFVQWLYRAIPISVHLHLKDILTRQKHL